MDYERIQKPQQGNAGGLSPGKLRSILLMGGADKKRRAAEVKVDDYDASDFDIRSQLPPHPDENGGSSSDSCKDVDVVDVVPECYASTAAALDMKMERATQRTSLAPFAKALPSKWDDAQKWIASPTSSRSSAGQGKDVQGVGSRKTGLFRQLSAKVVLEVPDLRTAAIGEPDTKRINLSHDCGGQRVVGWETYSNAAAEPYGKPVLMIENAIGEPAINFSQHDGLAIHSSTTFIPPPSTARSVSMRDMGTEMTPIASQEPSRTGTPAKATTPTRSPDPSRPPTPPRGAPSTSQPNVVTERMDSTAEMSQKELQMETRKEIIALGTQLGKLNIAAWASKEEEYYAASTSLNTDPVRKPAKTAVESRAAAWEDAEKAKYMARFKREEMKIEAWENHQKAKTEAEMRKIEMEVERIRGRAQDKLMNKLAAARHKAEERRAAVEARRNSQAAKTEEQAEYIRKTGRIPSSFSCCGWCS